MADSYSTTVPLSKMDFRRQVAFALISSAAIEAMHWSGMFAATFYVVAGADYPGPFLLDVSPPTIDIASLPGSATPHGLAISVILVGFTTCMLSYVLLARSVTQSRDELVAAIHTKRTLWRVMAEREAAVRADKQKTEFIAVASHEIRVSCGVRADVNARYLADPLASTDTVTRHFWICGPARQDFIDERADGMCQVHPRRM